MLQRHLIPRIFTSIRALLPGQDRDVPFALRMEQFLIAVRWAGICVLAPALPLTNLAYDAMIAAYFILLLAALYNFVISKILQERPNLLRSGYITTIGDGLLNVAMISVGGGFGGPFYFLLFTLTISAVMRYGYGPAMMVVSMYIGLDFFSAMINHGEQMDSVAFLFRSAFLMITTVLAGYLREQARSAEQALESQLHQASALNESTQPLSASLNLPIVTKTIVESGRKLTNAEAVVLRLGAPINQTIASGSIGQPDQSNDPSAILEYCKPFTLPAAHGQARADTQIARLPDGRECHTFHFLSHKDVSGTFSVVFGAGQLQNTTVDESTISAFVERAALAIEKALLYKALADRTDELRRAYAELAAAHQELISIDEMKTNFLANVSHELRTPLTAIRSFSEILLSYENDRDTQEEFIGIINSESERLTRLVNDVLDITKIEAGRMEWHMDLVQIDDVLRESARTVAALVEEKGLQFELDLPGYVPPVWADRDRITQVVANLLGNAIKFTNTGSIRLTARVVDRELHTSIIDTGVGIAPEDQKRIFEKFQQVGDTLTDKPRGTGLGLCLCRDILSHQGGRIWVKSALLKGSAFSFSLPLAETVTHEQQMTVYAV